MLGFFKQKSKSNAAGGRVSKLSFRSRGSARSSKAQPCDDKPEGVGDDNAKENDDSEATTVTPPSAGKPEPADREEGALRATVELHDPAPLAAVGGTASVDAAPAPGAPAATASEAKADAERRKVHFDQKKTAAGASQQRQKSQGGASSGKQRSSLKLRKKDSRSSAKQPGRESSDGVVAQRTTEADGIADEASCGAAVGCERSPSRGVTKKASRRSKSTAWASAGAAAAREEAEAPPDVAASLPAAGDAAPPEVVKPAPAPDDATAPPPDVVKLPAPPFDVAATEPPPDVVKASPQGAGAIVPPEIVKPAPPVAELYAAGALQREAALAELVPPMSARATGRKASPRRREAVQALEEGWLQMREHKSTQWMHIFCVLRPDEIAYKSKAESGSINVAPESGLPPTFLRFQDAAVIGDGGAAVCIATKRPHGFVVYAGAALYFDAGSPAYLDRWIRALSRVIPEAGAATPGAPPRRRPSQGGAGSSVPLGGLQLLRRRSTAMSAQPVHGSGPDDPGAPFRWLRVEAPATALLAAPAPGARELGAVANGEELQVSEATFVDVCCTRWAELSPFEAWRRGVPRPRRVFVRVAAPGGVGAEPLAPRAWPGADAAERMGLRWAVEDSSAMPPPGRRARNLCSWEPEAYLSSPTVSSASSKPRGGPPKSRIAACAVAGPGSTEDALRSWLLYHLQIGVERLYLYISGGDVVGGTSDLIRRLGQGAADAARGAQAVVLQELDERWWLTARQQSRFFGMWGAQPWAQDVADAAESSAAGCSGAALDCVCADLALLDAHALGVHWFVRLGPDELLYLPSSAHRQDAPGFFGEVPADLEAVRLLNHEAVPDGWASDDCFRDVRIFKPSVHFLWEDGERWPGDGALEDGPASKVGFRRSGEAAWDRIQAFRRSPPAWSSPSVGGASFSALELQGRSVVGGALARTAYAEAMAPVYARRAAVCARLGFSTTSSLFFGSEAGCFAVRLCKPGASPSAFAPVRAPTRSLSKHSIAAIAAAASRARAAHSAATLAALPVPAGPRGFVRWRGGELQGLVCSQLDGFAAPVVLRFWNCSFPHLLKRYQTMAPGAALLASAAALPAERALLEMVRRGAKADLQHFFQLFIMGNTVGELPHMCCYGLVLRIDGVREILDAAGARSARSPSHDAGAVRRGGESRR